jgi:hypothetical protein
MSQLSTGSALGNNITFNSGIVTINGKDLAVLQDVTVGVEFGEKEIYALGSIKMVTAPKRYGFKATCKGKTKSLNPEFYGYMLGSSTPDGGGTDYVVVDGQNVLASLYVTCIINESAGQTVQFQYTNAVIHSTFGLGLKMEDSGEVDFQITAQDMKVVTNF